MLNLPKLIGHRGVKNLSPENTVESINLANKLGLNWIEFDVKISKDLIPVLFHDDTLERTTDGKGLPVSFNYSDLRRLDAGSFFYKKQTEIYIPTLKEVLSLGQDKSLNFNIELKPNIGFEKENVESIAKIIKNTKFLHQYYFSSFDLNSLIMMKKIIPDANYGLLIDNFNEDICLNEILKVSHKYNFFCCGLDINIINSEIINKLLSENLIITIYSDKNLKKNQAIELWLKGISTIFIDDPSEFSFN